MGYADGFYYGQGRIICDTSTFSVGDTIRVRSVYNVSQTEDKQVVTVGTPLIFTVPPYDEYKICIVEDIGGVDTEIGGEYRTIDYGQTVKVDTLNLNSLAGHQALINAHQHTNKLAIGDEVTITVGGNDWVMQVADFDTYVANSVIYVSKEIYSTSAFTQYTTSDTYYGDSNSILRSAVLNFYSNIAEKDKQFLKKLTKTCHISAATVYTNSTFEDYAWLPNEYELVGEYPNNGSPTPSIAEKQFALFLTSANRIKSYNGSGAVYWTCDGLSYNSGTRIAYCITANGTMSTATVNNSYGVLPCFMLTADS